MLKLFHTIVLLQPSRNYRCILSFIKDLLLVILSVGLSVFLYARFHGNRMCSMMDFWNFIDSSEKIDL